MLFRMVLSSFANLMRAKNIPQGLKPHSWNSVVLPGMNPRPTAPGMTEMAADHEPLPAEIKANEGWRGGILVSHPSQNTRWMGACPFCRLTYQDGCPRSLAFGDRGGGAELPVAHPLGQLPASFAFQATQGYSSRESNGCEMAVFHPRSPKARDRGHPQRC